MAGRRNLLDARPYSPACSGMMIKRIVPLAVAAALAFATPAAADIHAVVVGIDAYRSLPKLTGAANDARDIAGALERLGAEVELLLDEEATRRTVTEAFRRQSGRAGPGDLFVFTYAGHGLQEDEAIPGDETDGKDETLVFAGFDWTGDAAAERLRDNEIGALLAEINPQSRALIVVDSCHSGTMTRAVDVRGASLTTRFGGIGRISKDPLSKPAAATKGKDLMSAPNVVFVAAARDDEQIPEVEIDGQMRGAVSWTVARALDGGKDFGGPDMPLSEFSAYVRAQARALSAARQTPSVNLAGSLTMDQPVVPRSARRPDKAIAAPQRAATTIPADRPPRIYTLGGAPDAALATFGEIVEDRAQADLIWDIVRGELIDRAQADLVAEAWDTVQLARALDKWRASRKLSQWALRRHVALSIKPDDGRHQLGETISLAVDRPPGAPSYLTLVNLASDGQVQFVFPNALNRQSDTDIIQPGDGMENLGDVQVSHPIGADHVVAIYSPKRPDRLHDWLESGKRSASDFVTLLRAEAGPGDYRVGVTPIFTTR